MASPHCPTPRPEARSAGLSVGELLILFLIAILLLVLLLPVLAPCRPPRAHQAKCLSQLRQLGLAVFLYANNADGHLPVAWGVPADGPSTGIEGLSYWRASLQPYIGGSPPTSAEGLRQFSSALPESDRSPTSLWTCLGRGWTRDYFGSPVLFSLPDDPLAITVPAVRQGDVEAAAPAAERPMFSEVNASLRNPKARDRDDPAHEAEMRSGFSIRKFGGVDIFVGVGPSLRKRGDPATTRIDFRHRRRVNVVYLDGHYEAVRASDPPALRRFHRLWDTLTPADDEAAR